MAKEAVEQTYPGNREQVFSALRATVAEFNYKDVNENPTAGTIEFRTGLSWSSWRGQQMTATVRETGPDATQVSITGGVALKIQVTSWGEKKKIADKVLAGVGRRLKTAPA